MLAYPIRNPDQVILYFALPTAAASFISEPKNSLRFAVLGTIGFTILYYIHFQGQVYPFFSVFCLFTIAIITSQVARIIQKMTEQLVATYESTIEGWSQALEMRNQETEGHSHRVADLTFSWSGGCKFLKLIGIISAAGCCCTTSVKWGFQIRSYANRVL